jgi:PAS domain-containing protein
MVMRVADQINTNFKRVFFFAHLSIASYITMLLYLMYVDHRTILLSYEIPKILTIYASNLYIALTARAAAEHRNRMATAVRVARDLILQLNEQSRQLEESKAHVEQLSRQNELILRSAGEGIYGLDLNGRATFVNPAVLHMSGYTAKELLGQPIHTLLYHSKMNGTPSPKEACPVFATLRGGTIHQHAESILWRKD